MITCPSCGHENFDDALKCRQCGEMLPSTEHVKCPLCGALNSPDRIYCRHCFADLRGDEESLEAEALISPYIPPAASPDEFRGHTQRPRQEPKTREQPIDLETPIQKLVTGDQAQQERDQVTEEKKEQEPPYPPTEEPQPFQAQPETIETYSPTPPPTAKEASTEPAQAGKPDAEPHHEPRMPPPQEEKELLLPTIAETPLEGVQSPIPMETVVALPHRASPPTERPLSAEERSDAELFRQIAEEPAPLHVPATQVLPERPMILSPGGRLILYLLVLLAALSPLLTGGQTAAWVQPRSMVNTLALDLSAVPEGMPVLISFDYSPAYAGELTPLARSILQHLAAQEVPIVALSTRPEGVGLAENLLMETASAAVRYDYGEDYILLGYLPGEEAGLRTLAHGFQEAFKTDYLLGQQLDLLPASQGLANIQDVAYILVLADDDRVVRRWIEQVGSRAQVPLHAIVTTRVEPMLIPYQQAGQLRTLIGAIYGAAQYGTASGLGNNSASSSDAFAALAILLFLVAIFTNAVYAVRGEKGPSSTSQSSRESRL
ncbi:MAG: zinc ribbon domain-containing protein [Chloroflexi bacterium]|nr:zinc ribbon domain-containing protein [Chloroflexota bacterium]